MSTWDSASIDPVLKLCLMQAVHSAGNQKAVTESQVNSLPSESFARGNLLFMLLKRSLIITIGGGSALVLGIVLAQRYPSVQTEPPLVEQIRRQTVATLRILQHSVQRSLIGWNASTQQSPDMPSRQLQLQTELAQLQTEFKALSDRTARLEATLGHQPSNQPLQLRLQAIQQQLATNPNSSVSSAPAPTSESPTVKPGISQSGKITLPSDILFQPSQSALRPDTKAILDSILADLQRYPEATVRISAHTDDLGETQYNTELSFRQAQAVRRYLAGILGDRYRWVIMGYGSSDPLTQNNTDANRQRNRRIEIVIDP